MHCSFSLSLVTGTDILLGGNPGYMARLKLQELLFPEVVSQGEACRSERFVCCLLVAELP